MMYMPLTTDGAPLDHSTNKIIKYTIGKSKSTRANSHKLKNKFYG